MARSVRPGWTVPVLLVALVMVASACSKSASAGSTNTPTATIFVQNFKYNGVPATVKSGVVQFLFENKESFPITHEMIPVAIPSGKTSDDIISDAQSKGPDSEDDWLHIGGDFGAVDTGASIVETLYLPPGTYAFVCWQTGTQSGGDNGPPHAAKGMVSTFTVS